MLDCIAYGTDSAGWHVSATLESFFKTEQDAVSWARGYFSDGSGGWSYIQIQPEGQDPVACVYANGESEFF